MRRNTSKMRAILSNRAAAQRLSALGRRRRRRRAARRATGHTMRRPAPSRKCGLKARAGGVCGRRGCARSETPPQPTFRCNPTPLSRVRADPVFLARLRPPRPARVREGLSDWEGHAGGRGRSRDEESGPSLPFSAPVRGAKRRGRRRSNPGGASAGARGGGGGGLGGGGAGAGLRREDRVGAVSIRRRHRTAHARRGRAALDCCERLGRRPGTR